MGSRHTEIKAIFDLAVETQSPSERTAYLQRACGGDDQLRAGVEALLQANDRE